MFEEDKDMIYFKPKTFREYVHNSEVYETLIFGGRPSYFLAKWKLPTTLEEWVSSDMSHMLEYDFYRRFKEDEKDFIIIDEHSETYFNTSKINIFRYGQFACDILENLTTPGTVTLFMHNVSYSKSTYNATLTVNGELIDEMGFCIGGWSHRSFDLNEDVLTVKIYEDQLYSHTKTFILSNENLSLFSKRGTFRFV
jgi:hypothetical protein